MQDMQVSELVARMRDRAATMRVTAEEYEVEAKFHSDKALDLRLGALELDQRITFITEFVDGEPDETPAAPQPGSEGASAGATSAGEAPPPAASPAPLSAEEPTHETGLASSSEHTSERPLAGHIGSWLRGDEKAEDAPPAGEVAPATPPAPTKRDLVRQVHEEHPDWTAAQAAAYLGLTRGSVTGHASSMGFKFASPLDGVKGRVKALHDAHPEYTRKQAWEELGITEGSLAAYSYTLGIKWTPQPKPVKASPSPAPVVAPPPTPPRPVVERPDSEADADFVPPRLEGAPARVVKPKGLRYRLRAGRGEGKYLHMSGVGLTSQKAYAWIGSETHMAKMRERFPDARDLVEELVEKEPARA